MSMTNLIYYALVIFAPVLVLIGAAGFLIPPNKSLTSGAPAYNVFHIVFGLIGLGIAYCGDVTCTRLFLIGFGAIDLYQALASFLGWFPIKQFRWTRGDDMLHVVIGAALILIGVLG